MRKCCQLSQPNYVCLSTGGKYIWNNTLSAGRTVKVYAHQLPSAVKDRRKNVGTYDDWLADVTADIRVALYSLDALLTSATHLVSGTGRPILTSRTPSVC